MPEKDKLSELPPLPDQVPAKSPPVDQTVDMSRRGFGRVIGGAITGAVMGLLLRAVINPDEATEDIRQHPVCQEYHRQQNDILGELNAFLIKYGEVTATNLHNLGIEELRKVEKQILDEYDNLKDKASNFNSFYANTLKNASPELAQFLKGEYGFRYTPQARQVEMKFKELYNQHLDAYDLFLQKVGDGNFESEVLSHQGVVMVVFASEQCGECRESSPEIAIYSERENKENRGVKVRKAILLSRDGQRPNPWITRHLVDQGFGDITLPLTVLYKDGKIQKAIMGRFFGVKDLKDFVECR